MVSHSARTRTPQRAQASRTSDDLPTPAEPVTSRTGNGWSSPCCSCASRVSVTVLAKKCLRSWVGRKASSAFTEPYPLGVSGGRERVPRIVWIHPRLSAGGSAQFSLEVGGGGIPAGDGAAAVPARQDLVRSTGRTSREPLRPRPAAALRP